MMLWSDTRFDRAHRFYEKRSYVRAGPLRVLGDKSNSVEFAYAKPLAGIAVAPLDAAAAAAAEQPLARVLIACVEAGASVSFMLPLPLQKARAFWHAAARGVARGERLLFAAWLDGAIVGTVQIAFAQQENQPHRADLQKLLVHPDARRHGIARRLLAAAEAGAAASGRTLLVLDTGPPGGAAEALYRSAGWQEVGTVPGYALNPDGTTCDTRYLLQAGTTRGLPGRYNPPPGQVQPRRARVAPCRAQPPPRTSHPAPPELGARKTNCTTRWDCSNIRHRRDGREHRDGSESARRATLGLSRPGLTLPLR